MCVCVLTADYVPETTTTTTPMPSTTTEEETTETTTPYSPDEVETTPFGQMTPIFTQMPDNEVYIVHGVNVNLTCGVMGATRIEFFCNGAAVDSGRDEGVSREGVVWGLGWVGGGGGWWWWWWCRVRWW